MFYRDVNCTEEHKIFSDCMSNVVGGGGNCANHSNDAGVICSKFGELKDCFQNSSFQS